MLLECIDPKQTEGCVGGHDCKHWPTGGVEASKKPQIIQDLQRKRQLRVQFTQISIPGLQLAGWIGQPCPSGETDLHPTKTGWCIPHPLGKGIKGPEVQTRSRSKERGKGEGLQDTEMHKPGRLTTFTIVLPRGLHIKNPNRPVFCNLK